MIGFLVITQWVFNIPNNPLEPKKADKDNDNDKEQIKNNLKIIYFVDVIYSEEMDLNTEEIGIVSEFSTQIKVK